MKAPLVAIVLALVGAIGAIGNASAQEAVPYGARCGVEMWAKKTLRDPAAARISTAPRAADLPWLAQQSAPADPDSIDGRLAPIETTLWRVRAQLVGYRLEDDGDYHLVLRDVATGAEMIGEIPAPYCVTSNAIRYAAVRRAIDAIGGHVASPGWWWLDYHGATPPVVTVEGVGFFDRPHEQAGAAPNGAELHPVLSVQP